MAEIKNIRQFEKFLHDNGFSVRESKILARSWRDLNKPNFYEVIKSHWLLYANLL